MDAEIEFILLVFAGLFFLLTLQTLPGAIQSYQIYRHSVNNRSVDVSRENQPLPSEALSLVDTLSRLGFQRLGEMHTPLPNKSEQAISWVFTNADNTIQVELVSFNQAPMVQFTTVFADDAVIEIIYPRGTTLVSPNYRSLIVRTTLEEAYQRHLAECETFNVEHGGRRRMATLRDVLAWEPTYRELYVKKRLRGSTILGFITLLWSFYSSVLFLVWGLLLATDNMTSTMQIILGIGLTITIGLLFYVLWWGQRVAPKSEGSTEL